MFLHWALLLLAASTQITGGADLPEKHIVGGEDVPEGGRPFQVSLGIIQGKDKYFHFCGGAILNEKWVVTAAHCLIKPSNKDISILSGTNSLSKGGSRHRVEKSVIHEKFDKKYPFDYDIALLKIKDTFSFDSKTATIKIARQNTGGGVSCKPSGWGYTDNNKSKPDKLKIVTVDSLTNQACRQGKLRPYQRKYPLTDRQICTYKAKGKGICQGDSGGPLTCNNELVGLMSYNVPCAQGYPDVYTRVYIFKDWIAKNMK